MRRNKRFFPRLRRQGTLASLPRKYLLVWFVMVNLDTEMLDRTDRFLSNRSDKMYLGQLCYVGGNEYSLLYYILT